MFIEFQFSNFRSFRDTQQFTMRAAPMHAKDGGLNEGNVFSSADMRLLKSKAIYGGNASGKSNLIRAISGFVLMVNKSVAREDIAKRIWKDRFQLLTDWDDQPIFFQYTFLLNDTCYRYGFQILNGYVSYEWLFGKSDNNKEAQYFMRGPGGLSIDEKLFAGAGIYMEQALTGEHEIFRSDALFLTGAALNGNKLAAAIRNMITSLMIVDGIEDDMAVQFAINNVLEKGTDSEKIAFVELLRAADTGIDNIGLMELREDVMRNRLLIKAMEAIKPKGGENRNYEIQTVFSTHKRFDQEGNAVDPIKVEFAEWESSGTAKLFGIGALVLEALRTGRSLVIDEFDARFHPKLTLKIVQLFNDEKTNPHHAQLIFVTHDTGLLSRAALRRDQICFVDKDQYGMSTMRTLIEYKGVRKDASYEKEYLQGSYAGVPYLDKIDWIITQMLEDHGVQETE